MLQAFLLRHFHRHPKAIIHLDAEEKGLPTCPDGHTRFVLLSDTHTRTFKVPDGDVLIHSGDLTVTGTIEQLKMTIDWICSLPHTHKVVIAGNHDSCLHQEFLRESGSNIAVFDMAKEVVNSAAAQAAGLIYLEDELVEVEIRPDGRRWRIFGSPWSAAFCKMAFNVERGAKSEEIYAKIPVDIDILVTHGPPYDIFDRTSRNMKVGCDKLLQRSKAIKPKLHVWGHIHEARNARQDWRTGTVYVNAANAGDHEKPRVWGVLSHQPIVIDMPDTLSA